MHFSLKRPMRCFTPCLAFRSPSPPVYLCRHHKKVPTVCIASESELSHTAPSTKRTYIHSPIIHRYSDELQESYAMWYTTHLPSNTSSIHLATSLDGLSFTTVEGPHDGAVLSKNEEQWWAFDTQHVTLGDVISGSSSLVRADGDVVFMYYTGLTGEQSFGQKFRPRGGKIGVALSKDGQYFSRIEGEFPSGAALEGDESSFDKFGVCAPCITRIGNMVVMHYHAHSEEGGYVIGRAISENGILFRKTGRVVLTASNGFANGGVLNPCIIANQGRYLMFVEAISETLSGIAVCESQDCENWSSLKLVLEGDSECSEGVGTPYALPMPDGSLRLYYTCYVKGDSSLALAESQGPDWTNFNKMISLDIQ